MRTEKADVIVIGGGGVGAACARDIAMRGLDVILLEKSDLASGTTGRCHGMFHSGARYAVEDSQTAIECLRAANSLRKIANFCIEDTNGMFVSLTEFDHGYLQSFLNACNSIGIPAKFITRREALELEPHLNPAIIDAILVPDASINPFMLTVSTVLSAMKYHARIKLHTEAVEFLKSGSSVKGIIAINHKTNETLRLEAPIVVNATGPWVREIVRKAGIDIPVKGGKGILMVIAGRLVNTLINRLRPPADGDIIVPGATTTIIGTTDEPVEGPEVLTINDKEINLLIEEATKMVPIIKDGRILRAYCGVRPLLVGEGDVEERSLSRGYVLFDHLERDRLDGLLTIAGGKLITQLEMAKAVGNLVSERIGVSRESRAEIEPLIGAGDGIDIVELARSAGIQWETANCAVSKYGNLSRDIPEFVKEKPYLNQIICNCESVSRAEILLAMEKLLSEDFDSIMRRTRLGMGLCQGANCGYKLAGVLAEDYGRDVMDVQRELIGFLKKRWQGMRVSLKDHQLRQLRFNEAIYSCVGNYNKLADVIGSRNLQVALYDSGE